MVSQNDVNSGSNGKGYGKKISRGSGRESPSMRGGFTESGSRGVQSSMRGGFAEHGSRGGRSSMQGGFAAYGGGGGFMGMLNNMDVYRPEMPRNEERGFQPRNDHSLPSQAFGYHLHDQDDAEVEVEEPVDDENEDQEEPYGEYVDDNVSIPSQTGSHTVVVQETAKTLVFIRDGTIDVLEPSFKCSEAITDGFKSGVEMKYLNWGKVPLTRKDRYFDEFKKRFAWDSSEEKSIRGGWNKRATKKFADFTSAVRHSPEKLDYILESVYNNWMARWASDQKFQERCAKMKVNRGRASIHNAGTRSFFNTADYLKVELKVDYIPAHTLFEHTHSSKKDGVVTWISSKAMGVDEGYQRELKKQKQEKSQNGTPVDDNVAYLKAAGGVTKSGVYGVDKRLYYDSCSGSSSKSLGSSWTSLVSKVEQLSEGLRIEKEKSSKIEKMMAQWMVMFQGMPNMPTQCTNENLENDNICHDNLSLD